MPRFFCENISDNNITLSAEDIKHITKVLRIKNGENITVCDKMGTDYCCKVNCLDTNFSLEILSKEKNISEPTCEITLYQALPKGDKMDFIVQKAVELGVSKIVPILTKYCVSRPTIKDFEKKQIRYQKIAYEASKQCGRGIIPQVTGLQEYKTAINSLSNETAILYYEHGGTNTNSIIRQDITKCSIIIGSEGGFCEEEIIFAKNNNINIGTLGKLILRCETAPIVALSLVLNATNNI